VLRPEGLNLRHSTGVVAGQDVFHVHLHLVPRFQGDTLGPGGVWGVSGWSPPPGGAPERARVAALLRAASQGHQ
jgi:histidine triad (HIT) family protein